MPRPNIFPCDTVLYHPVEGERLFPQGEQDPGPLWSDKPGGEPVGKATTEQSLKDLIAAQEQVEAMQRTLASREHDLAQAVKAKEEALAQVADLEQRAIASESARADAELIAQHMSDRYNRLVAATGLAASEVADKRTLDTPAERASVKVPENWRELPFFTQKSIAAKLTDNPVKSKEDVVAAIEQHLAA